MTEEEAVDDLPALAGVRGLEGCAPKHDRKLWLWTLAGRWGRQSNKRTIVEADNCRSRQSYKRTIVEADNRIRGQSSKRTIVYYYYGRTFVYTVHTHILKWPYLWLFMVHLLLFCILVVAKEENHIHSTNSYKISFSTKIVYQLYRKASSFIQLGFSMSKVTDKRSSWILIY